MKMNSLWRHLLFLGEAALLMLGCSGSSLHSLRYFYTSLSDPGQFYLVGYVDDQPFLSYDMVTSRVVPLVSWMEEVGKVDPQYWDRVSGRARDMEFELRMTLLKLQHHYNQSKGTGTMQGRFGCEVGADGFGTQGYFHLAYNGEDFLSFNKENLTWVADTPEALEVKTVLGSERSSLKIFLEEDCVARLRRNLKYGNKTLQRKVPPTVKVARRKRQDGQETLVCRAYGFYPKEINITWTKDGMKQEDTLTGGVIPNSDWTYHQWLSIDVDPKDRDRYQHHVEHDGLRELLDLPWEEPASLTNMELILGVLVTVLPAAVLVGEVIYYTIKDHRAKGGLQSPSSDGEF